MWLENVSSAAFGDRPQAVDTWLLSSVQFTITHQSSRLCTANLLRVIHLVKTMMQVLLVPSLNLF